MKRLWNKEGIPQNGWTCVDVEDIRADGTPPEETHYATCDMCGCRKVRFIHRMEHLEFGDIVSVGGMCAAKMAEAYVDQCQGRRISVADPQDPYLTI